MKNKLLFSVFTFALSASSIRTNDLCSGFAPHNDRYIPVSRNDEVTTGISESDFNSVLDKVQSLYTSIIQEKGGTFEINRLWTNGTVNASAEQIGETWVINMWKLVWPMPLTWSAYATTCEPARNNLAN
jgi:hypothetical protein